MRFTCSKGAMLIVAILVGPLPGAARSQEHAQVLQGLGPQFAVFREKVQDELKLTVEQKSQLNARAFDFVQETLEFMQRTQEAKPEERPKKQHEYAQKAGQKLDKLLKGNLNEAQIERLRQIALQLEGLFALGRPELMKELMLTEEQRKGFIEIVMSFQKQIEPLARKMQEGGDPQEFGRKAQKLRDEHQIEISALLTDAQKARWKEMLGKPFKLEE